MKDNLYVGQEAREKLMVGVRKVSDVVGITMGGSGTSGLIETIERPYHWPTEDGYQLANAIKLADPLEEMGRLILCEAINRANRASGDGSSTTCVLTSAILEEGIKHLDKASPLEIRKSLESCIPLIEKSVNAQKKEITVDSVASVASISAADEGIGKMIQEIYQKIGPKGIINWDVSRSPEDSYEIGTGIEMFDATYITPYMADLDSSGSFSKEAKLTNPAVLLARKKLTPAELDPICEALYKSGENQLLVFCDEMDIHLVKSLLELQMKNSFRTVVVKMPIIWNDEWWEDLEIASGGKIISGVSPKVEFSKLGRFGRVKITKEGTLIEGTQDLKKHILALNVGGSDEELNRAARLNTQTARYYVGGHSEAAIGQRRMKVEDAIGSASCALENGVVVGGGVALLNASKELPKEEIGGIILKEALKKPFRQICLNAGLEEKGIESTESILEGNQGFNSKTGQIEDLMKSGIVDATDVTLNAIKAAIGVSASILTIGSVITLPREEPNDPRRT